LFGIVLFQKFTKLLISSLGRIMEGSKFNCLELSFSKKNEPQILVNKDDTLWRKILFIGLVIIIVMVISINLLVSLI